MISHVNDCINFSKDAILYHVNCLAAMTMHTQYSKYFLCMGEYGTTNTFCIVHERKGTCRREFYPRPIAGDKTNSSSNFHLHYIMYIT